MMYINRTVSEILEELDNTTREKAQRYLDSKKVLSVKMFDDGDEIIVEAFIADQKGVLYLPCLVIDENVLIADLHCQCCDDEEICIHKLALLLATQVMLETSSYDYHMARKLLASKVMSSLMFARGAI